MTKQFAAACFVVLLGAVGVRAQSNEFSFMAGGGALIVGNEPKATSVWTLAYARNLTRQIAVEGSLDVFFDPIPQRGGGVFRDDYEAFQVAGLYHFRFGAKPQRLVPYLTAGVGRTSTDFTEIPGATIVRLGGGVKYFFGAAQRLGLRLELRHEIIGARNTIAFPPQRVNLPSARVGVVYRF